MSPDEAIDPTYQFFDEKKYICLILIANGLVESKDCEIDVATDYLEAILPNNLRWKFEFYNQIHADQTQQDVHTDDEKSQTVITFRLLKQREGNTWPQLHREQSVPITPHRKGFETVQDEILDGPVAVHDLNLKKLKSKFMEDDSEVHFYLNIPHSNDCEVGFKETSFTILCTTKDESFLIEQNIPENRLLKLVVPVKERIIPDRCTYSITSEQIKLTLIKENPGVYRWNQIAADEHSNIRAIPLPMRSALESISEQKDYNDHSPPMKTSSFSTNSSRLYSTPSISIGYTGIYNPANSCFMNAAVQCLANTRELRDYFLESRHRGEINQQNPLGMKGEMAEELGMIIRDLWSGHDSFIYANRLRDLVAKRHQEFVGNGQHDAQELLNTILDAVHEDLNRVLTKPLVPPIEDQNRPDETVADEFWRGYLSRNDSIVVQLFTGQFKSKTKCPQCQKESVTFDPFTTLSVPVPKRTLTDVIFIFRDLSKGSKKYRLTMQADAPIKDLKRLLSSKCAVSPSNMIAYKILYQSEIEYLKDDDRTPSTAYAWNYRDYIFVAETLSCDEPVQVFTFTQRIFRLPDFNSSCAYCHAPANPLHEPRSCPRCFRVSYCDEKCLKFHQKRHQEDCLMNANDYYETIGLPFIVSLPESQVNYRTVVEQIKSNAERYVDIYIAPPKSPQTNPYGEAELDDEEDSFSDVEGVDWAIIKQKLASSDSWSICRLGDYFVQKHQCKRTHDGMRKTSQSHSPPTPSMMREDEIDRSGSDREEYDMLEDVYPARSLFRLMPQSTAKNRDSLPAIIEEGDEANRILRRYTTFFVDWYTDNNIEAPLRVLPSSDRIGLKDLTDHDSVMSHSQTEQDLTLTQCLQTFIEPEVLGPEDKWYCPHCKEHIQAEKKMSIWRLPPILVIHLKRFKYNHSSSLSYFGHSREKIETNVKFPIHDLDMAPYCSSTAAHPDDPSGSRYDLFGIIQHHGTAWFGHYTADARLLAYNDSAKSEITWRHFDDSRVTSILSEKDLAGPDAYVLFYRHRHLQINLPVATAEEMLWNNDG